MPPKYYRCILDGAAHGTQPGERGALLPRDELSASHLTYWRRELRKGAFNGLEPKKRGPKSDPLAFEINLCAESFVFEVGSSFKWLRGCMINAMPAVCALA